MLDWNNIPRMGKHINRNIVIKNKYAIGVSHNDKNMAKDI